MWTLIVLGLIFLGWYIMSPQGEAGAAAEAAPQAPEAPPAPAPAEDHAATDGSEFASAQAAPAEAAPAETAPAPAESGGGSGSDDPFKAPGS